MGVQFRQNSKSVDAKGMIASMSGGKRPEVRRHGLRPDLRPDLRGVRKATPARDGADAMTTLRALAQAYEQVADSLLAQIHDHADNLKTAQALSRHLDWVGARAQLVDSFIKAGDCALAYICASQEAHDRLMPLVQLTAHNATMPGRLPVALFLMEKIDEELRLV
ncbi:hypothetical protein [Dongia mobilis]|uniref:hypothetical protein n=1 Tax=Dongia sp. TaxID=1977262 RepID=UPI0026EB9D06